MNRITQFLKPTEWLLSPLLALVALTFPLFPVTAQAPGYASLPGHVVKSLANAKQLPHDPQKDDEQLTVTIMLNLSDSQGAEALKQEYLTPTAPNYHKSITPAEFTRRFGPSQEAWDAVVDFVQQNSLTLTYGSENRRIMSVIGTRAQVQRAFGVSIEDCKLGDRSFHAIATDPVVPESIAPLIANVAGLSNVAQRRPAYLTPTQIKTGYASVPGLSLPPQFDGYRRDRRAAFV